MFVFRVFMRGHDAIKVDDGIVRNRLVEDRPPTRPQHALHFLDRSRDVEMMKDACAADDVERMFGKLQRFRISHRVSKPRFVDRPGSGPRALDRLRRKIDSLDECSTLGESPRVAPDPTTILEDAFAGAIRVDA